MSRAKIAVAQHGARSAGLGTIVHAAGVGGDPGGLDVRQPDIAKGTVPETRRNEHPEEDVLRALIAAEQPIIDELNMAKAQLTAKVLETLNDPRRALLVSKVLREVVASSTAISRRIENVATALASLRVQRQMLAQHRGPDGA